jgi:hypothetical protein
VKRFLFITSTNLASNPRLLKELRLATDNGFVCSLLQFRLGNWSDLVTEGLKSEFPRVSFIELSALRKPFLPWLLSSILERIFRKFPLNWLDGWILAGALDKRTWLIYKYLNKINQKFDWIIAHNPAAFYPAMIISKRYGAKLGIDVEDYHPGETNEKKMRNIALKLMQIVLPTAFYCSYASPLIMSEVKKNVFSLTKNQYVILNGFSQKEFLQPMNTEKTLLKLVWFSQNISDGRGLELIIPVVEKYSSLIELHLIGSLNSNFFEKNLKSRISIKIHKPMPQVLLHQFLSQFDAGLATDIPVNLNRDIALTNKIIAYSQAGLFIIAMHTKAHDLFLKESNLHYIQMRNANNSIEETLLLLVQMKQNGFINKSVQFSNGIKYSWENISKPLLEVWCS